MLIEKLIKYIQDNDLKKKKVAGVLGISAGHLSYILNYYRDPSIQLEEKIKKLIA